MTTFRKFDWNRARKDFFTFFDDFEGLTAANWVITNVGVATEVLSAGAAGGVGVFTNAAADNDLVALQWAGGSGAVSEQFKFTLGKKLHIVGRAKILEVIQCDFMMGLWITDTDPIGGVSDGLYVRSNDGSAAIEAVAEKNSTESVLAMGTLVANTFFDFEMYYDGSNARIEVYFNGARVGALPLTNMVDDEEIAVSFALQNGEAVANVLSIDYIGAALQR